MNILRQCINSRILFYLVYRTVETLGGAQAVLGLYSEQNMNNNSSSANSRKDKTQQIIYQLCYK